MKTALSPDLLANKIKHWCAYQERSQYETRLKLYTMGVKGEPADALIVDLIAENYINEERFAIALAGGKFRIKLWGKKKIKAELRKHQVSEYSIKKALDAIDPVDYEKTIDKVIAKSIKRKVASDPQKQYYAALNYLVSKGFESDLVSEKLSSLIKKN